MRFLIAAALFVVSVFALLFGVAERTIWAPPANYSETLETCFLYSPMYPFSLKYYIVFVLFFLFMYFI